MNDGPTTTDEDDKRWDDLYWGDGNGEKKASAPTMASATDSFGSISYQTHMGSSSGDAAAIPS